MPEILVISFDPKLDKCHIDIPLEQDLFEYLESSDQIKIMNKKEEKHYELFAAIHCEEEGGDMNYYAVVKRLKK